MTRIKKPKPGDLTNAAGRKLMAALRELHHAVMSGDQTKHTVKEVEIPAPGHYGPREVRTLREAMNVSQGVFAIMVGVSPALVQHWEHGFREPSPLARRLLDKVKEDPAAFANSLVRRKSA